VDSVWPPLVAPPASSVSSASLSAGLSAWADLASSLAAASSPSAAFFGGAAASVGGTGSILFSRM